MERLPPAGIGVYDPHMPRDSRIASEPARRAVLAVVMAGVLAASTGWAVVTSQGVAGGRRVALTADRVRSFALERPAGWERADREPDGEGVMSHSAIFTERGGPARRLIATEIVYPRSMPPTVAMRRFLTQVTDEPVQARELQPVRIGPFFGLIGAAVSPGRQRQVVAMSIDGRRYLGLSLSREGFVSPGDLELLTAIAQSVRDERLVLLGDQLALPIGRSIEVPDGLSAAGLAGEKSLRNVVFYPTEGAQFFTVGMSPIELWLLPDLAVEPADPDATPLDSDDELPPLLRQALEAHPKQTPPQRLLAQLMLLHFRATGRLPPEQAMGRFEMNGQAGFAMLLNDGRQGPAYEALRGVTIDAEQAVVLELVAEPQPHAVRSVQEAASALMQTLTGGMEAPAPPVGGTPADAPGLPTVPGD